MSAPLAFRAEHAQLASEYDNMLACIRCALCLTSCPTYVLSLHESESPRGRVGMARGLAEGHLTVTRDLLEHESNCLVCDACSAVCPAGVHMDPLQVVLRSSLESSRNRPWTQTLLRDLVFGWLFMDLARFRLVVRLVWLYQRLGLQWLARSLGILKVLGLADTERLLPKLPSSYVVPGDDPDPSSTAAFFAGCVMSTALADVDRATLRVLDRAGFNVNAPKAQGCCGALHAHGGDLDRALQLAKANIAAFEQTSGPIVVNSAGCGAMLKDYGHHLRSEPDWAARAKTFSERIKDFSQVLADKLPITHTPARNVVYQDACHLIHAQRISRPPRDLLRSIPDLNLREIAEPGLCCGSAGIYNVTNPVESRQLQQRKLDNALAVDPDVIVTANPGCLLQLQAGLRERGSSVQVKHLAELLDEDKRPVTLASELKQRLTASRVLDAPAELRTYAYDASFLTQLAPRSPDAVVIAGSTEDVAAVMRFASERSIPVTPRGAASGQAGGAVALEGGIVLALNALNEILDIDVGNMQVICQPGVVHAKLNEALAPHRLIFPPDPGSSRMATVGGMASTNAHGMRAVKYGPTSVWVLGLEVVLADGTVIETGSAGSRAKQSSAGLELTKLIVGAEGTLGVVTRLRLKLMAIPPARAIVLGLFDALEKAGQSVQTVFASGISPSAIEILDERSIQAINLYRPAMNLPRVEAMLLFEVDGNPPGVRWDAERIVEVVSPLAREIEWSDEPARIAALWEARSVVGAAVGMLRPGSQRAYCGEDIAVPVSRIPEALRAIQDISARHGLLVATYGHIGGGGLHPGILIDGHNADEIKRALQVADDIHHLALRMGGTVTGEHGVGAARAPYMAEEHGPALEVMRRLKQALDPKGIMNPGVIFNTPDLPFEFPLVGPVGEPAHATIDPGQIARLLP